MSIMQRRDVGTTTPGIELDILMSTDGKVASSLAAIATRLGDRSIDVLYRDRIRPLRTRSYALNAPPRVSTIEIHITLLGTELKIGRRRLLCPDIATARFLSVFAGIGVKNVAVPYDITQVKRLADVIEAARDEALAVIDDETRGMSAQARGRVRSAWTASQRKAIEDAGAGPIMPQFDQSTRQRRRR